MNEDSFVKTRVDPIMLAFFKNEDDIVIDGCTTTLKSSDSCRKKFDPILRGKIPDMTVSVKLEDGINNLIIMEVKPPATTTDDADLLKMANMMKDAMDAMQSRDLDSLGGCVMGVLVEGYRCNLYIMDLDYTFIYRLYKMGTFYIPRDRYDFDGLSTLIEHMITLRRRFDYMVAKYHNDRVTQLRVEASTPPRYMKKTKPSFLSPVCLP
ncbi:unnamed protein product [Absidia cylindrospora]